MEKRGGGDYGSFDLFKACGKRILSSPGKSVCTFDAIHVYSFSASRATHLGTRTSGQVDRHWDTEDRNPSRQQDFLQVPWLESAEPVISISKSQNVGLEPLPLERRGIGTCLLSMAGILKGFCLTFYLH